MFLQMFTQLFVIAISCIFVVASMQSNIDATHKCKFYYTKLFAKYLRRQNSTTVVITKMLEDLSKATGESQATLANCMGVKPSI
jgi:hypothetical protein